MMELFRLCTRWTSTTSIRQSHVPRHSGNQLAHITIVFVTGYGLTAFHTKRIERRLNRAEYSFHHIQLPALRPDLPATQALQHDENTVFQIIDAKLRSGQDIALVLHSSSIGPGLRALSKAASVCSKDQNLGKVVHTFLIAAQLPDYDADITTAYWLSAPSGGEDAACVHTAYALFTDLSPYEARANMNALIMPHMSLPTAGDISEVASSAAADWDLTPCTNIVCTKDQLVPPAFQIAVATRHGVGLVELASDHSPMVSHPDELVSVITRIIEGRQCS